MDPQVEIDLKDWPATYRGPKYYKSKVLDAAGKTPAWNEKIAISVPMINSELILPTSGILLRVMDEDITNHDVVGESVLINLKEIFPYTTAPRVLPVKLLFKGKEAGVLNIEYQFEAKAPVEKKMLIDGDL